MRGHPAALALVLCVGGALSALAASCEGEPTVLRDCFARIWVSTSAGPARIVGSWDDWSPLGVWPEDMGSGWSLARLELPPGEHQYLVVTAEGEFVDPFNALTSFRASDGREVSSLLVPDCERPLVDVEYAAPDGDDLVVRGRFLSAQSAERLDPDSLSVTLEGSQPSEFDVRITGEGTGAFEARLPRSGRGKRTIAIEARDGGGVEADAPRVVVWDEPLAERPDDALLYQIMIDRFLGDGGAALPEPATPGSRAGGTLDGIRAALEQGMFDELGVTGLWLSPVYVNPIEARPGNFDGKMYEGYHGYWPAESERVEPRIGGDAAFAALVEAAHARGMTVLADLVPNHVDITNPRYEALVGDDYFHPEGCVCGTTQCPWSEAIERCWFTPYLPDVRWQHPDALSDAAGEATRWLERFDLDGFRVDAVPMMPRAATRRIARVLRDRHTDASAPFLLGEVFTGPGAGAYGQLRSYLGPDTLDSVFDFPLMWALRDAIAGRTGFEVVDSLLDSSALAFRGSGATIATMLDNHDVPRFMASMTGDDGRDAWAAPPEQPTSDEAYARMRLGLVALLTLPGMPVLYYGDEVGLTGAGDPDNRRVFPAEDALLEAQRQTRELSAALGQLRRCEPVLRRGDRTTLVAEGGSWAFARRLGDEVAIVAINASSDALQLPTGAFPPGSYRDALTGTEIAIDGSAALELEPLGARILVSDESACGAR
jgi:glycosidase